MAKINEIGSVLKQFGSWRVLKRLQQQISEDNLTTLAAALAYTWLFALFPFLVFLLGLVPLTPEKYKHAIIKQVGDGLERVLTHDAAEPLKQQVGNFLNAPTSGLLSFGLLFTIYGASKGMATTIFAIDRCYDVKRPRGFWAQQLLSVALTVVVTVMVLLVMILLPVGTGVLYWLKAHLFFSGWLVYVINLARYFVAISLLMMILAIIYHFGPTERPSFVWITPGAVFCLLVWLLLGISLRYYMSRFHVAETYEKTYGAVAGAAIVLLIFYFDALVLLVGAEINSEIDLWRREAEGKPIPEPSAIAEEMKSKGEPLKADSNTSA